MGIVTAQFIHLMKSNISSMKIMKYLLIGVAVIVLAFLTINIFAPSKLMVEKSIVIDAPASVIFEEVNDFHNWGKWDPWKQADPNMQGQYSGPDKGVGATWTWESETQGNGTQKIVESRENEYIKTSLQFTDWDGMNYSEWFFEESENGTKVTWNMDGAENPFMFKFFNLIMKPMVEGNYDLGLSNLKELAENKEVFEEVPVPAEELTMDADSSVSDSSAMEDAEVMTE